MIYPHPVGSPPNIGRVNPNDLHIDYTYYATYEGEEVIAVMFDCCGRPGDVAYIDKETGKVLDYFPSDHYVW